MVFWEGYVSDDFVGIISPVAVYWLYSGLYHMLDAFELQKLEKCRLHPRQDVDKKNLVNLGQVVRGVILQQAMQVVVGILLLYLDPAAQANQPVPPLWKCCVQFAVGMFMMDSWQYFMHRLMHQNKFLYRNLHSWHHRLVVPFACGALYNHPVEGLIMDTVGGALSYLLSGMHIRVAIFFWCFATMKTVDDHCGLMLTSNPFQLFFKNNAPYHDVHHQLSGLKYNFSQPFFTFWDRVLGTYMPYTIQERQEGGLEVRPLRPNKASAKVASTTDEKLADGFSYKTMNGVYPEEKTNSAHLGVAEGVTHGISSKMD